MNEALKELLERLIVPLNIMSGMFLTIGMYIVKFLGEWIIDPTEESIQALFGINFVEKIGNELEKYPIFQPEVIFTLMGIALVIVSMGGMLFPGKRIELIQRVLGTLFVIILLPVGFNKLLILETDLLSSVSSTQKTSFGEKLIGDGYYSTFYSLKNGNQNGYRPMTISEAKEKGLIKRSVYDLQLDAGMDYSGDGKTMEEALKQLSIPNNAFVPNSESSDGSGFEKHDKGSFWNPIDKEQVYAAYVPQNLLLLITTMIVVSFALLFTLFKMAKIFYEKATLPFFGMIALATGFYDENRAKIIAGEVLSLLVGSIFMVLQIHIYIFAMSYVSTIEVEKIQVEMMLKLALLAGGTWWILDGSNTVVRFFGVDVGQRDIQKNLIAGSMLSHKTMHRTSRVANTVGRTIAGGAIGAASNGSQFGSLHKNRLKNGFSGAGVGFVGNAASKITGTNVSWQQRAHPNISGYHAYRKTDGSIVDMNPNLQKRTAPIPTENMKTTTQQAPTQQVGQKNLKNKGDNI